MVGFVRCYRVMPLRDQANYHEIAQICADCSHHNGTHCDALNIATGARGVCDQFTRASALDRIRPDVYLIASMLSTLLAGALITFVWMLSQGFTIAQPAVSDHDRGVITQGAVQDLKEQLHQLRTDQTLAIVQRDALAQRVQSLEIAVASLENRIIGSLWILGFLQIGPHLIAGLKKFTAVR